MTLKRRPNPLFYGTLLRSFFYFLYHPFAFAYDLVAWVRFFRQWQDWILSVVPFIDRESDLEIGHGPGHLQRFLLRRGLIAVAIDKSALDGPSRQAQVEVASRASGKSAFPHSTFQSGYAQTHLTRGLAQELPFCEGAFDTVIATFPAEYISDPQTMSEVKRCLSDGGRFVVLPVAMPKNRFLSWLFRVTGQAPSDVLQVIQERLKEPFVESAFDVETHVLERSSGTLIIIVATARAAVLGEASVAKDGARNHNFKGYLCSKIFVNPSTASPTGRAPLLALIGLIVLLIVGWETPAKVISLTIYGVSLIAMFSASATYHMVQVKDRALEIFRKIDHSAIYLLIAGTYTPFCVNAFEGFWKWGMLGIIWSLAVIGIIVKVFYIRAPRWLNAGIYILMGWLASARLDKCWRHCLPGYSAG